MQNLKIPTSLAQFLLEYMELNSPCIVKETIDVVYKKEINNYFKKIDKCAKK